MGSEDPAAAIISMDLGTAAAFDQTVFPLAYYEAGDNFAKGTLLIRATLDEMEAIKNLGIDLNKNDDFIFNTRLRVEASVLQNSFTAYTSAHVSSLRVQKEKLQDNRKTLNPFKAFLTYRTARLFHAASRAVYLQTKVGLPHTWFAMSTEYTSE